MLFEPIEGKTKFTKSGMIAYANRRKFPTNEAQFERWVDYGLIGKGREKGKGKATWSLPQMHLFLKLLEQNQRPGIHPIDLCTIPVWMWLYLGDEADIEIEQVERVMWTWQSMQRNHPATGKTREMATKTVGLIASKHAVGKRKLINDMVSFAETLEYPTPEWESTDPKEDFLYDLSTVVDPRGRKEHNGPQGAPLTAQVLSAYYEMDRTAVAALLEKKCLPRKSWTIARHLLLYERAKYQQEQPQFAHEVAGKSSAELFHHETINELVSSSCRNLRLVLGTILSHPALCEEWEQQREAKSEIIVSPLLLPNGTHYSYLRLQAQRK